MGSRPPLPDPYRQDLARIGATAQQLGGLVQDVLDLARSQVGQLRLATRPVDVATALQSTILVGEQMARSKGLDWQVEIAPDQPEVCGDILHQEVDKATGRARAIAILDRVGFPKPRERVDAYPHQLLGGLRQRAVIAMALSCHPSLLIADEPTTALDVTTEAQILRLMRSLQIELGMAILFITHNLGVVAQMCEDVIVMYMGRVVEECSVDSLFHSPLYPYSQALLRSIPKFSLQLTCSWLLSAPIVMRFASAAS